MTAYLFRRLLLVIPTLFGIIAINFAVIQFAPGGPVEQMIAELRGKGDLSSRLGSAASEFGGTGDVSRRARPRSAHHRRHQEDVRLRQAAADPLPRHGRRLSALRLRPQLLPRSDRAASHPAEDAGVDLARPVVHAAGVSGVHSARHRQGGARRQPIRRRQQRRGAGRLRRAKLPVRHPAGRAVRRRQLLPLVSAARPDQRRCGQLELAGAHRRLRLAHGAADHRRGGGRLRQPDDADQELLPRGDPQAVHRDRPRQGRRASARCCTATCSATPCC